VDDGSSDSTAEVSRVGGAQVLSHRLNRGQGAALKTGIDFAKIKNYELVEVRQY